MLSGKNILIGITGGIAAYKVCELIRMFKRNNADVKVVATENAMNFVSKLTLQCLTQNDVAINEFDIENYKPEHISYTNWADIYIIAPATANTISKIANGICDNLLTSIACAFYKPVLIAPAMNTNMWNNPIIQENLNNLQSKLDYEILQPDNGYLACGTSGTGRLCDLQKIYNKTVEKLTVSSTKKGCKIVITAGGTIEDIDPVRYISNYSSGKMGIALADYANKIGCKVVLVTTVDVEKKYKVVKVKSAQDMKQAVENEFDSSDILIMAAAVADYRVKNIANQKIKKTSDDEITIELIKNPDILKSLCDKKQFQIIVGFCAESENLIQNAKEKIQKKGCDYLIANDISRKDIGFNSNYNEVTILDKTGNLKKLERADKQTIAKEILDEILK